MGSLNSDDYQAPDIRSTNPLDSDEFRRQGHMIVDFLSNYYRNIEDYPVRSEVEPNYLSGALPGSAPNRPESIEAILEDIRKYVVPGLTHSQSPNLFGYYQANTSTAGILGDIICSGFNVMGMSWVTSPAATELENLVMDWLGEILKLPKPFLFSSGGGGIIHGNTGEALICTLTAARDKVLKEIGEEKFSQLVVYCSDQTHCSLEKVAHIVGIRARNIRKITTTKATHYGMCPDALRLAIASDIRAGLVPLYLCATVGTTPTCAVDPIEELCKVVEEFGMWIHVDAAYAGAACICPEYRYLIDGIESVNSFSFNAHKWFLSGLDCCCVWLKNPIVLTRSLSADASYLHGDTKEAVINYKDWQVSLSRRFRALRLWLVLRSHGVANLRKYIQSHVRLASIFEQLVAEDDRFEVFSKRRLALVCFRISPSALYKKQGETQRSGDDKAEAISTDDDTVNKVNEAFLQRINRTGRVFITHAVVEGTYVMRFAVGATLMEERHVRMAWKLVQHQADVILSEPI
ncbi:hypothetical protein SAY86_012706 [Trapa natans]|uniref:Tyrosine decarboxylase n=1 Tax=Trapa natans TaxID=22666 RepID=A0AAN7LY63_TRANT|nr:hypothetical protein SAY86_012706 [Trapa natans]